MTRTRDTQNSGPPVGKRSPIRARLAPAALAIAVWAALPTLAAETLKDYYAHPAKQDAFGVIAPWNDGCNGPLDERLRIAVEVLKRYPWVEPPKSVVAAPDFVYNSHWSIRPDGTILIPPTNDWMCGDLSQRAWSIVKGLTDYYAYSGDPIAFTYIPITADYILEYAQTPDDAAWPRFPIATPTKGKAYGKCDPTARNQLDLCAILGTEFLRAYRLTGDARYLDAAKHWGDVFAEKCRFDPTLPPWSRYVDPAAADWSDELTGGVTLILAFLDDLVGLGHEGQNGAIVRARDAGREYVAKTLLPQWLENDTWGRNYWDWDNPVMCGIVSMCGDYILANPQAFPHWKTDLRNVLTLIFNRNGADPNSHGDMYHGAWAFPESCTCCGTSLSYNQFTAAPTLLRYAHLTGDPRVAEIGRRMMIMACYDADENGVVKDGLFGRSVATGEWSNLAHPWPLCQIMEAMKWTPAIFAPRRENHIVRTTSVVQSVVYAKGRVAFTVFDAPSDAQSVLRLSFLPDRVTADGRDLPRLQTLDQNGYQAEPLDAGDYLVVIRHDGARNVVVTGPDPQRQVDDRRLKLGGQWRRADNPDAWENTLAVAQNKDASCTLEFSGNQVRVIGSVDVDGGLADVYLDGEKQPTLVDCWSPRRRDQQVLYARSGLPNTKHLLEIVAAGKGNPRSSGANVYVDAVQYSDQTAASHFGAGGGPKDAQRMIFGYPHRRDYVDSQGHAWRPATEWVIRSGYGKDTVKEAWWTDRRSIHIAGAKDEELYRYGAHGREFWVNLTAAPGTYRVTLHFADTPLHWFLEKNAKGGRITHTVDVDINDRPVLQGMNVTNEAGGMFHALSKTFENIKPANGAIEIHVKACDDQGATLQAVEVIPTN
ncbi:MAG: hypothetical protein JW719_07015 [Pirellulales bacterium]|nr:hypothetical protein [Pirellulales bacterium]